MIVLYALIILLFALIIWLVVRKKWKALIWSMVSVFVLVIGGWYLFLYIFSEAFGEECDKSESWEIEEYRIQRYKCLGWAGPHYYPADLFKNGKRIDQSKYLRDSCFFKFRPSDDLYLEFNICDKSIKEIRANKRQLDFDEVSSVNIRDYNSGVTKKLGEDAMKKFIKDWNRSKISGHRDINPIFHSENTFEISVSLGNNQVKFYGSHYLIADETNWVYYINKNDTTYFKQLMN